MEYSLRSDEVLSEPQVRQVMEYYLAVRMRRFGRGYAGPHAQDRGLEPRRLLDDRREPPMLSAALASHSVRPMSRPMPVRARSGREAD